jgi:hypothetical protein
MTQQPIIEDRHPSPLDYGAYVARNALSHGIHGALAPAEWVAHKLGGNTEGLDNIVRAIAPDTSHPGYAGGYDTSQGFISPHNVRATVQDFSGPAAEFGGSMIPANAVFRQLGPISGLKNVGRGEKAVEWMKNAATKVAPKVFPAAEAAPEVGSIAGAGRQFVKTLPGNVVKGTIASAVADPDAVSSPSNLARTALFSAAGAVHDAIPFLGKSTPGNPNVVGKYWQKVKDFGKAPEVPETAGAAAEVAPEAATAKPASAPDASAKVAEAAMAGTKADPSQGWRDISDADVQSAIAKPGFWDAFDAHKGGATSQSFLKKNTAGQSLRAGNADAWAKLSEGYKSSLRKYIHGQQAPEGSPEAADTPPVATPAQAAEPVATDAIPGKVSARRSAAKPAGVAPPTPTQPTSGASEAGVGSAAGAPIPEPSAQPAQPGVFDTAPRQGKFAKTKEASGRAQLIDNGPRKVITGIGPDPVLDWDGMSNEAKDQLLQVGFKGAKPGKIKYSLNFKNEDGDYMSLAEIRAKSDWHHTALVKELSTPAQTPEQRQASKAAYEAKQANAALSETAAPVAGKVSPRTGGQAAVAEPTVSGDNLDEIQQVLAAAKEAPAGSVKQKDLMARTQSLINQSKQAAPPKAEAPGAIQPGASIADQLAAAIDARAKTTSAKRGEALDAKIAELRGSVKPAANKAAADEAVAGTRAAPELVEKPSATPKGAITKEEFNSWNARQKRTAAKSIGVDLGDNPTGMTWETLKVAHRNAFKAEENGQQARAAASASGGAKEGPRIAENSLEGQLSKSQKAKKGASVDAALGRKLDAFNEKNSEAKGSAPKEGAEAEARTFRPSRSKRSKPKS